MTQGRLTWDGKIDLTDPNNLNDTPMSEKETRRKLMLRATYEGYGKDLQLLFDKYDHLIKQCTNDKERADLKKLAIYDIWVCIGRGGKLYADNKLIASDD